MPGSHTHDAITLVTAAGAAAAYYHFVPHPVLSNAALFVGPYVFAGFACAGDLDLNSREYRRWGPLRCIWWPYRQMVPHRSWVSHGLIMGGVIRILYLIGVLALLSAGGFWLYGRWQGIDQSRSLYLRDWASLDAFVTAHPVQVGFALAGFILAGTVHSLSDAIGTWLKRTS